MKRLPKASKNVLERFIATNASYIEATANEARLRAHGEVMSIEEYIPHRRENGGVRPCFDLIELVLGVELPEELETAVGEMYVFIVVIEEPANHHVS